MFRIIGLYLLIISGSLFAQLDDKYLKIVEIDTCSKKYNLFISETMMGGIIYFLLSEKSETPPSDNYCIIKIGDTIRVECHKLTPPVVVKPVINIQYPTVFVYNNFIIMENDTFQVPVYSSKDIFDKYVIKEKLYKIK